MPDGEIIPMKDGTHAPFFRKIIKSEFKKIGMPVKGLEQEENLDVLFSLLLNQFQILPYQGCSSGDRVFHEGCLYVNSLEQLTDKQLPSIIDFYSAISPVYDVAVYEVSMNGKDDRLLSLGEVYEEMVNRPTKKL